MTINIAIVPVAGLGTSVLPLTKSQPKEMLAVGRKPVVQYVVEELASNGIDFRDHKCTVARGGISMQFCMEGTRSKHNCEEELSVSSSFTMQQRQDIDDVIPCSQSGSSGVSHHHISRMCPDSCCHCYKLHNLQRRR